MAKSAAEKENYLSEENIDELKGTCASSDNFGFFFAQNIFPASAGVLLIQSSLNESGYKVDASKIALASIPVAIIVFILSIIKFRKMDKRFKVENIGKVVK